MAIKVLGGDMGASAIRYANLLEVMKQAIAISSKETTGVHASWI